MELIAKRALIAGYIFLALLGCVRVIGSAPAGFVEGHLKIVSLQEVELGAADEKSPAVAPKTYACPYLCRISADHFEQGREERNRHGDGG